MPSVRLVIALGLATRLTVAIRRRTPNGFRFEMLLVSEVSAAITKSGVVNYYLPLYRSVLWVDMSLTYKPFLSFRIVVVLEYVYTVRSLGFVRNIIW